MSVQEEPEDGWKTPTEESEEEDELFEDSQVLLDPGQPSSSEPVSNFSIWKKIKESNKKCKVLMVSVILLVLVCISVAIIVITWPPKGKPRI
jgi:hypothetical protein